MFDDCACILSRDCWGKRRKEVLNVYIQGEKKKKSLFLLFLEGRGERCELCLTDVLSISKRTSLGEVTSGFNSVCWRSVVMGPDLRVR